MLVSPCDHSADKKQLDENRMAGFAVDQHCLGGTKMALVTAPFPVWLIWPPPNPDRLDAQQSNGAIGFFDRERRPAPRRASWREFLPLMLLNSMAPG
jgi:hypothetical protein